LGIIKGFSSFYSHGNYEFYPNLKNRFLGD